MSGRTASTQMEIDRHFPFQVEVAGSDLNIGARLHEMSEYCRLNRFEFRTRGIGGLRLPRGRDGTRWCFRLEEHAIAFHREYGGEQIRRG